jgi:glycine cleavage system H protein
MVAILVVLAIVAFITADAIVQWAEARRGRMAIPAGAPEPRAYPELGFAFEGVSIPSGLFLDRGHTWVGLETSGKVQVGVDALILRAIGRIDAVELPEAGREVKRGEMLFAVRQGERRAVFTAPVDGVIGAVNESLKEHPEAIKTEPYRQGWVCMLNPSNLARNLSRLSIAEMADAWLNKEMRRFQEFIAARPIEHTTLGQLLQDGGRPTGGILELMDEETWAEFTREFLRFPAAEGEAG